MSRLLTTVLLFGAVGSWLALEFKTHARLFAKISPLREKAVQLGQVNTDNRRLLAEVGRLNALRREQADVIHALALKRAEALEQQAPGFKPVSEWKDSGNTTPSAAYETYVWALDHADMRVLAGVLGMTPEEKAKVTAIFSNLPAESQATYESPEMMFALLYANRNPVWFNAMDVAGETVQYGGALTRLTVDLQYAGGQIREHEFYIARFKDGWKNYVTDVEVDNTLSSQLGTQATASK